MVKVRVSLKESILEPQGLAASNALQRLGHTELLEVRIGKFIELRIQAKGEKQALEKVEEYCKDLLINPLIEVYECSIAKEISKQ